MAAASARDIAPDKSDLPAAWPGLHDHIAAPAVAYTPNTLPLTPGTVTPTPLTPTTLNTYLWQAFVALNIEKNPSGLLLAELTTEKLRMHLPEEVWRRLPSTDAELMALFDVDQRGDASGFVTHLEFLRCIKEAMNSGGQDTQAVAEKPEAVAEKPDTGTGQSFDDQPEGKDLLGVSRLAKAIVDIHCRAREDAQVPSNIALYAEWGGGKSFARGN